MNSKEGVGQRWSVAGIPDQTGRRILITGANSGIGYYAAAELARKGATVLLACRDRRKGEAALASLRSLVPEARAELEILDMASLASIRRFAERENARGARVDVLINNAGVMTPPKRLETADGFELQFGTNVLGHFALTALLLPALERAATAASERPRVVTIASIAHKQGRLNFDDLQSTRSYNPMAAYRQSKLANLMFAFELDRRLRECPPPLSQVMSIAAHPGVANTNLFKAADYPAFELRVRQVVSVLIGVSLNTEAAGAVPTVFAATAPEAQGGGYYGPQGWQETRGGDVGPALVAPQARDAEAAKRLWQECERLTGISAP